MVKLEFLGANNTVTGSKTLVEFQGQSFLIDCGLFQGDSNSRQRNRAPILGGKPLDSLDGVILTHAHMDHSGLLAKLWREGYRGPIYASEGTFDLCKIMLLDGAHLEEEAARYANHSGYSKHSPAVPLYTVEDAKQVLKLFKAYPRNEWITVGADVSVRFIRSGHIIGSSFVQMSFSFSSQKTKSLTFSGDVGHEKFFTLLGPDPLPESDVLVLESTYGNRVHSDKTPLDQLQEAVEFVVKSSGILLVPAFAVGRCQEILYLIRKLERDGRIPEIRVVLDSPMAHEATKVFLKHREDHKVGPFEPIENFLPRIFHSTRTLEESHALNHATGPMVIISASGMLTGGRILHHLKQHISNPKNLVLFTGYQAENTKGRYLQENAQHPGTTLRIFHEEFLVLAKVMTLEQLSSHADYKEMIAWLERVPAKPQKMIINHGTVEGQLAMSKKLKEHFNVETHPVFEQTVWDLW